MNRLSRAASLAAALVALATWGVRPAPQSRGADRRPGHRHAPAAYYVAVDGAPTGDGSREHPWDIHTALAGADGRIQPADTVWLRGGRYVGHFVSRLTGTPEAPIIVRQVPGERATLDNPETAPGHSPKFRSTFTGRAYVTLKVAGEWVWYWGFEVIHSSPDRDVARTDGVYPTAPNNRFINLVIHDNAVGVSFSNDSRNSEVYGCVIYNNGYSDIDRTHGHGIYAKNDGRFLKRVRDNIVFNQFRNGIQVYTDAGSGQLKGFLIEGNVWFNNGVLTSNSAPDGNILIGGREPADQIVLRHDMTYFSPGVNARNVRIGYKDPLRNGAVTVQGNYFVGGNPVLTFGNWNQARIADNVLAGSGVILALTHPPRTDQVWSGNRYVRDPDATAWTYRDTAYTFEGWRHATRFGATDQADWPPPSEPQVFVRPNAYERGRANIIVYNWSRRSTVSVDVSGLLHTGDRFAVHNVQDFFGTPVLSGTYAGGPLVLPMTAIEPPRPIGGSPGTPPRTGPDFNVFVLTSEPAP